MLIPLPLGKAKLTANFDNQYFGVFPVKYNRATYRLVFLQFGGQLMRIKFDDI
jgi:hypothetical protein